MQIDLRCNYNPPYCIAESEKREWNLKNATYCIIWIKRKVRLWSINIITSVEDCFSYKKIKLYIYHGLTRWIIYICAVAADNDSKNTLVTPLAMQLS